MVKISDIAEKANVSTATVSNVINNNGRVGVETRKKVISIIEELNYKPNNIAKSLKMQKTNTLGVIVEDLAVFNAPEIIDGINDLAEKHGYSILLTNMRLFKKFGNEFPNKDECNSMALPLYQQLVGNRVEGIIYIGIHSRDVTGIIPDSDVPIVYTYCYTTNEGSYNVNYDDDQASYDMTEYLINKGHKNIGLISGMINSDSARARFSGFRRALMDHKLIFNPSFIKAGDWQYETGYSMTKDLLKQSEVPSAIIAMNDFMAGGAIQAAKEFGLSVPEQLSVVGFDNREISEFYTPRITTMSLPLSIMGEKAVEILINAIDNSSKLQDSQIKLRCTLIERDSVNNIFL